MGWPSGGLGHDGGDLTGVARQFVAVLGGSGAGKGTLLRCIARLLEPTAGRVVIDGADVTAARGRPLSMARARAGFAFHQFNLPPPYTALDNGLLARVSHPPVWSGVLGRFTYSGPRHASGRLESGGGQGKARQATATSKSGRSCARRKSFMSSARKGHVCKPLGQPMVVTPWEKRQRTSNMAKSKFPWWARKVCPKSMKAGKSALKPGRHSSSMPVARTTGDLAEVASVG